METLRPLTRMPLLEPASVMVQLPSSYRVKTAWLRDTVGKSMKTSLDLLRPMTFSQWVMANFVPSFMYSQAQISGSLLKVIRGFRHRQSRINASAGAA